MKCSSPEKHEAEQENQTDTDGGRKRTKTEAFTFGFLMDIQQGSYHTCWGDVRPSCISWGVCRWCSAGSSAPGFSACSEMAGTL